MNSWDMLLAALGMSACHTFWFWYLMTTKERLRKAAGE